ncbi:DUF4330 family protein [Halomicrobium sp. HM KBTZ05]|uniref:DUF4330 family protein n=1 Tax=Halomicrobium sp. HM KBTZ05 TaxID=3242663 RepID=UPI003558641C
MQLIDDEGNLFGRVNVIDAFVVALILAVVIAGGVVVFGEQEEPELDRATTNVTLDLGSQPGYIVAQLRENDSYAPTGTTRLTITDLSFGPADSGTRVLVRAELRGIARDGGIDYDGEPPRLGRTIDISTETYRVSGVIRDLGGENTFTTAQRSQVLVRDTVSADTAAEIAEGDTYRIAGRDVATVESVSVYGTNRSERKRVYVGLTLTTTRHDGGPNFGTIPVREGASIPFETAAYELDGTVERVGATEQRGEATTRTVTVELENVSQSLASAVDAGGTETAGGTTIARVESVDRVNATVVTTSDDGEVYARDHPTKRDLTIEATLSVRETAAGLTFKGEPLQYDSEIVLDLGDVTVRATVVSL